MNIAVFSSGSLSLGIIQYIFENFSNFILITKSDKHQGRGMKIRSNIVKQRVTEVSEKVKVYEFDTLKKMENTEEKERFENLKDDLRNTDLAISCDIGLIIPEELINLPKIFINIHPSLLPLYRGPSPIQYTLLNGDELTGITICLLSKEVDKGDIILQSVLRVEENDNFHTLKERLSSLAVSSFKRFIKMYEKGELQYFKQDENKATYTKKIEDTILDFSKSAEYLHNQVRAFYPNAYIVTELNNQLKRIKILKTKVLESIDFEVSKKGLFLFSKDRLFLHKDSKMVEILEIHVEGKKPISPLSFINGYLKK
ncbi:MAG: methionyl-tRNA formyltransferase [Candidatus Calescibacterium sp.]|nr:methionyl-tRNA formyltransferase [Candidatus Calescibacterium sp.]MDW8132238.1 methionyl-tRNA formyltransferase [Candidatus Calescibacterium sp.]